MNGQKALIYEFDSFRLDVGERQLLRDGKPVTLSSRAFDLLRVLVENNRRLISKDELYSRVWHDQIVEESNLSVQMSAIRRALGENRQNPNYIGTIIGSGYRFTADVRTFDDDLIIESETVERIVIEEGEKGRRGEKKWLWFAKNSPLLPFSPSPLLAFRRVLVLQKPR